MIRYLLSLLLLVGSVAAVAQTIVNKAPASDTVARRSNQRAILMSGCPGNAPFLWHYQPQPVAMLEEISPVVVANVRAYLLARVGKSFFETVTFAGGQQVELTGKDSVSLGVNGYHWKLATYYLRFHCQTLKEPDGSCFEAGASFDTHGNVVDSINLPAFSKKRNNFTPIAVRQAVQIGRSSWPAAGGRSWISKKTLLLSYSPLNQALVWWFSKATAEGPGKSRTRRIIIDAANGTVLRVRDYTNHSIPF